jgi:ribulose-5-phosphate 4-epimerase/fuculose-1-phosphate aldolase
VIEGCRRLARKGFLNSPEDSFSIRIPGEAKILLATGLEHWAEIGGADLYTLPLLSGDVLTGIHAAIYEERGDAGAVAICSPQGARMLARHGGILPPLFDEQARHIGRSMGPLPDEERVQTDLLTKTLRRGVNAVLLGERLLCLGMTCERALFNVELYEKCARAYVIARSAGSTNSIPWWVRFIANRRLFRNQADAAASYRTGRMPEGVSAY